MKYIHLPLTSIVLFITGLLLILTNEGYSQTISGTTYPFSNTTGAVLEVPTGAVQLIASGSDNVASAVTNIGFDFWFTGTKYTQFSVNENGLMKLGSTVITTEFANAMASSTNLPKIAPYWDDLATGTNGNVQSWVTGTAPNRKLVVQWNVTVPKAATSPANATFQAWLYESTGVIEFVYGSGLVTNANNYSIGIGNSASLFASVNPTFPFANYGIANDANTLAFTSGTKYTFTPLVPPAPTAMTFPVVNSASMTISWTNPGVTSAVGYVIYNSLDNINFNFVTQVASGLNSAAFSGLTPGTLYYYKVFAVSEGGLSTALTGSQSTNSNPIAGTKKIGTTGSNYTSITAAIADIQTNGLSGSVILELQSDYTTAGETFPITFSGIVSSAVNNLTIRPAAGVSSLTITQAAANPTILLNGGSYITIDGRPGGIGSTKALTISNAASAGTIVFQNDAANNLVEYCNITGISTSSSVGIIMFSTTTGTTGNSNNTINNCNIDGGASGVNNAIYSLGTVGKENKLNTISNNNISNFFNPGATAAAIALSAGTTDWTISGNSFFQTFSRASNQAQMVINITVGTNYFITGNYFGGTAPLAAGTPWTTSGAVTALGLTIINVSSAGSAITVSNNTITNFSLSATLSSTPGVTAITASGANVTVTNNIIGSNTPANAISVSTSGTGGSFTGIYAGATVSGNVSNNNILGITASGTGNPPIYGISTGGAALTINANTIGSLGSANNITGGTFFAIQNAATGIVNITNNAMANSNISSQTIGIYNTAGAATISGNSIYSNIGSSLTGISNIGAGAVTITNNIVYNDVFTSGITGINASGGTNTITLNTIKDLSGLATSITGISATATLAGQTVSQNVIDSLVSTSAGTPVIRGIYYSGPTTGTNLVSRNFIHSLDCTAGGLTSSITGIYDNAGTTTYQNNMIRLGIKPDGTSITIGLSIIGINQAGGTADKFYFNSVYIGGSGVATGTVANTTFAFNRATNTTLCDVRDNIFVNARSNGAGAGKHYVMKITSATDYTTPNLTLNNNIYYGTGTGSVFGLVNATDYTFPAWKGLTGFDAASPFADPNYVTPLGNSSLVSLNVQSPTPAEGNGILIPSVTDDYSGQLRASFTPTDIGANAGNFGSVLDVTAPAITYTALLNAGTTGNRILTATITDQTGVPVTGSLQPRIYFKKMFAGAWFSTQGVLATGNGTNGTWNFTINTATLGGVIAGTDSVYYYVIAQDLVGTPNIGSSPSGVVATDVNTVTVQPANPNKYKVLLGLSGIVTVGTGGNYTSLTVAGGLFSALSTAVLTANVTVNVTSDLTAETGAITLGPLVNDGTGVYTVTINPVGARTISGTSVSPALINVNGTSGFTIDGLNTGGNSLIISNLSASYPTLLFTAGASNNIVRNTTIKGANNTQYGAVVYFGNQIATSGNNNNSINNCIITSSSALPASFPTNGITFYGNTLTPNSINNVVDHCTITNFISNGINCFYYYNAYIISNNEIYNATPAGSSLTGIFISNYYGNSTSNVFNNKIHDLNPASTTSSGSIYGINSNGNANGGLPREIFNMYNNQIYLDATVSNTTLSTLYGISASGNGTANVYYNSIYIGGTGISTGSSAGLAFVGSFIGPENFNNNAVFNARSGGVGPHYGINCSNAFGGVFSSNYNDIYVNGIGSMFGNYKGNNYQTLSTWSAASGQDLGSFSGNPGFTSATNLTPNVADPNTYNLNGNGLPIAGFAVDYTGAARSVLVSSGPSDIGAFEFTPTAIPNAAVQLGNIQVGNTTAYYIGGKLAGTIQWTGGTALPTSISFKYWAGIAPPAIPNLKYGMGYFEVVQTGGTNYTYNITLNYSAATLNTISSESNITLSKKDGATWAAYATTLDTVGKKITLNGLNLFSLFALVDKSALNTIANLKIFLEGPYNAGSMTTTLNTMHVIPLTSDSAYSGVTYGYTPRTVVSIPNANVVDWMLIELRSGTASATKIYTTAGFLLSNGSIVDLDGVNPLTVTGIAPGNYYVVIRHRNHLAVMSSSPITLNGSSPLYDFTTGQTQAFGTNPLADLTGGIFGMVSGDANNDGQITSTDYNIFNPKFFSAVNGYDVTDWNLDGQITSTDFNIFNVNFYNARTTQVPF